MTSPGPRRDRQEIIDLLNADRGSLLGFAMVTATKNQPRPFVEPSVVHDQNEGRAQSPGEAAQGRDDPDLSGARCRAARKEILRAGGTPIRVVLDADGPARAQLDPRCVGHRRADTVRAAPVITFETTAAGSRRDPEDADRRSVTPGSHVGVWEMADRSISTNRTGSPTRPTTVSNAPGVARHARA